MHAIFLLHVTTISDELVSIDGYDILRVDGTRNGGGDGELAFT
jgi:hypothetical protein